MWWPAPAEIGGIGEVVETDDDVTVQVTGPPGTTPPPAGAPGWLGEFEVVTLPVRTVFRGDARRSDGTARVRLIGIGQGHARLVTVPPCAAVLEPFRDTARATSPAAAGPLCFAVPPGFRPHYLALTANATGPAAVIDLRLVAELAARSGECTR
ncbi:hypothetical protein [Actinomadura sp. HBU206391]|uniref:hypothetical protein n=1 Tax=Actinomadura sp. HBU206391 TaxID=2731692 RepID=UPI001650AAF8|nr:hypothetical protein [Actinomadura sp. HBU206391]MBC6461516.1 hypothetical protein [Actinomadura sp. HBU206391]